MPKLKDILQNNWLVILNTYDSQASTEEIFWTKSDYFSLHHIYFNDFCLPCTFTSYS